MIAFLDSLNINIGILVAQIVNVLIVLFVFKRTLWDTVAKHLEEKRKALKRLWQAEITYAEIIADAKEKSQTLIAEWLQKKEQLITEAGSLAEQKKQDILDLARKKAEIVRSNAELASKEQKAGLEKNFVDAVKHTAKTVVKKMLKSEKQLKDEYFKELSADFA